MEKLAMTESTAEFVATMLRLMPEIFGIQDLAILRTIYGSIETAKTPDELRMLYAEPQT